MILRHTLCLVFAVASLLVVEARYLAAGDLHRPLNGPLRAVESFLKATQARDLETAYSYISSADRSVQDKSSYVQSQVYFSGFALELAKRLTADMEIWAIEQEIGTTKAHLEVGYRVPTADELSPRLLDWAPDKLNALSPGEQFVLLQAVERLKKSPRMISLEGREIFDLVWQTDGWKIYFDWRSRARVTFKTSRPGSNELEVKFFQKDVLVKNEEPFQIDFTITNRTNHEITARLNHRFEPRRLAGNVDMIACGLLAPLRLGPKETRDLSSAYLLRGKLPTKTRLTIVYDFSPERTAAAR
ncbi:MAG TPA: cytochrome c oxidase assembly protein [Candidatus Binatia bacterium]|jgi:hypothetical protein